MTQQNKRNSLKRNKALFGDGAIMAAAIAAQTAAQTGMAAAQASATREAAMAQANAIKNSAQNEANAMANAARIQSKATQDASKIQEQISNKTNEVNKQLAQQSQDFTKTENEQARDLQEQMQMNLQLAMGQENSKQRREAARITVRNGGNVRRSLKRNASSPFTGELGFRITDGDKGLSNPIIPLEYTPDGLIFMFNPKLANHGEANGDGKKGLGIANGPDVKNANLEVEGGEVAHAKYGSGIDTVLSKRDLPHTDFNPVENYLATGDFPGTYNIQEDIKDENDIPDGYYPSKKNLAKYGMGRRHKLNGGIIPQTLANKETIYNQQPNLNTDTINGTIATLIATQNNNTDKGYNIVDGQLNQTDTSRTNVALAKYGKNIRKSLKCGGRVKRGWGGLNAAQKSNIYTGIGSGISLLGSGLGYLFTSSANRDAARYMSEAYDQRKVWEDWAANQAANYGIQGQEAASAAMHNAGQRIYDTQIEGMSREEANRFGDALPALRTIRTSVNAPITKIDRDRDRAIKNIRRNTLSSAAAQMRELEVMDRAQQARNQVYAQQAAREDEIRNANADIINKTQNENLNRALMAQREYMNNKLQVDAFNAGNRIRGIEMMGTADADKALGIAGIQANRVNTLAGNASRQIMGTATTDANATIANAQALGSMLSDMGTTVSSGLNTIVNTNNTFNSEYAKATPEVKAEMASIGQARAILASYDAQVADGKALTPEQANARRKLYARFPSLRQS